MSTSFKIVFSGTPEFASTCLEYILKKGHDVVLVITAPDRKKGRGQQLSSSPVKQCAQAHSIPVLQPDNLKDESFLKEVSKYNADIGVVVAFRMMPEKLWNMPPLGTINLHASLLPDYRGAAPINWAIINGEKKTGLSTFFLKHEIDTGDIILREEVEIREEMDAGMLHDDLAQKGAALLSETLSLVRDRSNPSISQASLLKELGQLHKAPKIFKEDCRIDWNKNASAIYNLIRGLSPYPGAWTYLHKKDGSQVTVKIYKTKISLKNSSGKEGHLDVSEKDIFRIGTSDQYLDILELQIEGRQRMDAASFLRGYKELLSTSIPAS